MTAVVAPVRVALAAACGHAAAGNPDRLAQGRW
jgi:hypothetical protein